jgi:hypothetical protein
MKDKKTVTGAVLAANRANAQSSTGPKTKQGKSNSSYNALTHGILARKVILETAEQRAEFQKLLQSCETDCVPEGVIEKFLVEEIATIFWKLGITEGLQAKELLRRQELSDDVDSIFHTGLELPISNYDLPLDRGWDCERIVVRAVAGKDNRNSSASRGPAVFQGQIISAIQKSQNNNSQEADHLEIEAVLGSALESITRYQAKLKRDLYRAIEALRQVQAERQKGGDSNGRGGGSTLGKDNVVPCRKAAEKYGFSKRTH